MSTGVRCPYCGHQIPSGRVTCPFCSQRLPEHLRQQVLREKEAQRKRREEERARAAATKAAAKHQVEQANKEVAKMNAHLEQRVETLKHLLKATLEVDDHVDFETLKDSTDLPPFEPGSLDTPAPIPTYESPPPFTQAPRPGFFGRLRPSWKTRYEEKAGAAKSEHAEAVKTAEADHARALASREGIEAQRQKDLQLKRTEHEETVKVLQREVAEQHQRIEKFEESFRKGEPEAVCRYFDIVLQRSNYPTDFPQVARLAYVPESKQLVIEYELPPFEVVPEAAEYKYVKAQNEVREKSRSAADRRRIYAEVVSQVTLRSIHEVFEADRGSVVETLVFNGMVSAIDKSTGQEVRPCLVTVRTTRDAFHSIDLARVEPLACLKALNASVSKSPEELAPVRPVLEFNMVDPRFVDSPDVLSEIDARPNLMELTPNEFEGLISNLFGKMGLEMRQTRPSRDGGVDCVAFDPRPIFGGKVVIQAKRYKNTVGVAAVRDLFGTLHNEGASKGILVTTSGYGQASFEFAQGKPMELLDGPNLLFLLAEHAGIEAKIEPPEDWVDPLY
jgi:restriction system protein